VTCNGIIACSNCTGVHTTKHISWSKSHRGCTYLIW
jgi:hypothetical protein